MQEASNYQLFDLHFRAYYSIVIVTSPMYALTILVASFVVIVTHGPLAAITECLFKVVHNRFFTLLYAKLFKQNVYIVLKRLCNIIDVSVIRIRLRDFDFALICRVLSKVKKIE